MLRDARSAPSPPEPAPTTPRPSFRNPLTAGGWSGLSFIAANIIGTFVYLPLARLLRAEDFGLFAEANLLYVAATLIAEGAVVQALVQLPGERGRLARAGLRLSVLLGAVGLAVCVVAAPLMALIYRDRALTPLLVAMAPAVLITGAGAVPHALLSRELDFRRKTLPETLSIALGGAAGLAGAVAGLGVYSLALITLMGAAASTVAAWWVCGWRPVWRRDGGEADAEMRRFVAGMSAGELALYARLNTDSALTGRLLGTGPLGVYSLAWAASAGPQLFIGAFTNRVGYALFARLQRDRERLRAVFLSDMRVITSAALPVSVGAVIVAPDLVPVALGRGWEAATAPAMVLFVLQFIRTISSPGASLVLALGRTRLYTVVGVIGLPLTVAAVLAGVHAGVTGVAWGMLAAVGVTSLAYLLLGMRLAGAGPRDGARAFALPLLLTVATAPAVLGARLLLLNVWPAPTPVRLAAAILAGVLVGLVVLWRALPLVRADLRRIGGALSGDGR